MMVRHLLYNRLLMVPYESGDETAGLQGRGHQKLICSEIRMAAVRWNEGCPFVARNDLVAQEKKG